MAPLAPVAFNRAIGTCAGKGQLSANIPEVPKKFRKFVRRGIAQAAGDPVRQRAAREPDHRHRCLLRARHDRPRHRRAAAKQDDEFAPSHA
jgi:hypothetical protein